jgi:hypothetical protein
VVADNFSRDGDYDICAIHGDRAYSFDDWIENDAICIGVGKGMMTSREELEKNYIKSCLEGEIYLWKIYILDHPEHMETYQKSIADNLEKLKLLEG